MRPFHKSSLNATSFDLFDHLPMVIFFAKDAHGSFVRCNPRFEQFHGLGRGEAIGLNDFSLHKPDIAGLYRNEDLKVMETGKPATNRIWLVPGANGLLRWWVSNKFPTYDPNGKVSGIAGVMYEISDAKGMTEPFSIIEPALNLIHSELHTNLSTAQLAAACHYSESQFNRIFRKLTGQSPRQYLLHHKIDTAKGLLARTDFPLSQIAFQCGFYDASDFGKRFREIEGLTPKQYRNNLQKLILETPQ
jgi:PAS domain S-box-containing protein